MTKKTKLTQLSKSLKRPNESLIVPKEPAKKPHFKPHLPYTTEDDILLVGEGNFSFASALCQLLQNGEKITATCYDSESILHEKYHDAKDSIEFIEAMEGTIVYQVDANQIHKHKRLKNKMFDKIVFNFPHGIKDQDRNILANQKLILGFLQSAIPLLKGEIHITVKTGSPYDDWNIKSLAKSTQQLRCKEQFFFCPKLYPGYEHRRTIGFVDGISKVDNEELKQCKTMVFVKNQV